MILGLAHFPMGLLSAGIDFVEKSHQSAPFGHSFVDFCLWRSNIRHEWYRLFMMCVDVPTFGKFGLNHHEFDAFINWLAECTFSFGLILHSPKYYMLVALLNSNFQWISWHFSCNSRPFIMFFDHSTVDSLWNIPPLPFWRTWRQGLCTRRNASESKGFLQVAARRLSGVRSWPSGKGWKKSRSKKTNESSPISLLGGSSHLVSGL